MAKKHDDDDEPVKNVKKAPAHDDDEPASPAVAKPSGDLSQTETPAPREPASKETTDAEDIDLLAQAIVALIQDAAYDDMTWPEIDRALRLTSHAIKQNWSATGTVKPAPPPEEGELTRMEDESDEDFAARKRAIKARHASGLESLSPAPRSRYAG